MKDETRSSGFADAGGAGPAACALVVTSSALARVLARQLDAEGMDVVIHDRPDAALRAFYDARPALVVLGDSVGDSSGFELLRRIRDMSDVPVYMLGEHAEQNEAVAALRAGADAYMRLPLQLEEFGATAAALVRRTSKSMPGHYRDGILEIFFDEYRVRVHGREVDLTPIEYRMLVALVQNANKVLSKEQLLEAVWDSSDLPRERVKLYIGYLRDKLKAAGAGSAIRNARGFGYLYDSTPVEDSAAGVAPPPVDKLSLFEPLFAPLEDLRGAQGQPFFAHEGARIELAEALVSAAVNASSSPPV